MYALLVAVAVVAAPVERGPCTLSRELVRTPYTTLVPVCGAGHLSLRGLGRAVRRWGPWALGAAALAVALGRTDHDAAPVSRRPHHHPPED